MKTLTVLAAHVLALGLASAAHAGAPDCGSKADDGRPGTVDGVIEGRQFCEYNFEGAAGQKLSITLDSDVPMEAVLYSPISQPLMDNDPVTLPEDAIYTVRVGMTGPIADNNPGPQSFTFATKLTGKAAPVQQVENDDHTKPIAVVETGGEDKPEGYIGGDDVATLGLDGLWEGVIPCASCPGIEVALNLYRDGTYTRSQTYQEEKDGVFQDQGDWFMQSGVIVLASDDEDEQDTFLTLDEENILSYADQTGETTGKDYRLKRTSR